MTYIDKCDDNSLNSDERSHSVYSIAELGLREYSMVKG
jgi:hypothetical protein